MGTEELGFLRKTNGLVMALVVLVSLAAVFLAFRPRRPSPFTAHGAYGAGHGSVSVMFGASPRLGAAK